MLLACKVLDKSSRGSWESATYELLQNLGLTNLVRDPEVSQEIIAYRKVFR
jgi:hypothetical protein